MGREHALCWQAHLKKILIVFASETLQETELYLDTSRGAMGMVQQGELKPNARRRSWGAWSGSGLGAQS